MNSKFDELAKSMAQSVTRRGALKQFGFGLAGMALACFGLANKTEAGASGHCRPNGTPCRFDDQCCSYLCDNNHCVCRPSGFGCLTNAQCCSGVCLKGSLFGGWKCA